jgi:superfamily II RNA helicase
MKIHDFSWLWRWLIPASSMHEEPQILTTMEQGQDDNQLHIDNEMPEFLKDTLADDSAKDWHYTTETATQERMEDQALPTVSKESENVSSEVVESSLLDNKPLVKVFAECADLLNELDSLSKNLKSEREQFLLQMVREKIRSALILSGGTPIDCDEVFDIIRHFSLNCNHANNGMPIQEFVESGIMLGERVFVRAKVNLKM